MHREVVLARMTRGPKWTTQIRVNAGHAAKKSLAFTFFCRSDRKAKGMRLNRAFNRKILCALSTLTVQRRHRPWQDKYGFHQKCSEKNIVPRHMTFCCSMPQCCGQSLQARVPLTYHLAGFWTKLLVWLRASRWRYFNQRPVASTNLEKSPSLLLCAQQGSFDLQRSKHESKPQMNIVSRRLKFNEDKMYQRHITCANFQTLGEGECISRQE